MQNKIFRISVSVLEKFRRFMAGTSDYDTEQALLDSITGKFEGTDYTRTGHAFHALIENPNITPLQQVKLPVIYGTKKSPETVIEDFVISEAIAFPLEVARYAMNYSNQFPGIIHEFPVGKQYDLANVSVYVSGRMDSIVGRKIRDAKTKYRPPSDIRDYTDSCQGFFYMDIFQLREFYFDIFEIKRFDGLTNTKVIHGQTVSILEGISCKQHEPIGCTAFINMTDYCTKLVADFMRYVDNRNIYHLLNEIDEHQNVIRERQKI